MANPQTPYTKDSEQQVLNKSFDPQFEVLAVENLVYNSETNSLDRLKADLVAGQDYDYLDVQQTDADTETYIFKDGGAGGTTKRTIVINYTDSTKTEIDNVSWS